MTTSIQSLNARLLPKASERFARDIREGLLAEPRAVPCEYLYDELGSALFEAITFLPEYGLTRAEERLIHENAARIAWRLAPVAAVVELGSGTGRKTRPILAAMAERHAPLSYTAIDVSASALKACNEQLQNVPGISIDGLRRSYLHGLDEVAARRPRKGRLLVLFLGGSIGNFDVDEALEFLGQVRDRLRAGDALLLGVDLVKHPDRLLAAYDDPVGVTAAFNLNLLARVNRELGGNFDVRNFCHEARWSAEARRIEMHLISTTRQYITIRGAGCEVSFRPGDSIWTESSYKMTAPEISRMAKATGFREVEQWIDQDWPFAENLWIADTLDSSRNRLKLLGDCISCDPTGEE